MNGWTQREHDKQLDTPHYYYNDYEQKQTQERFQTTQKTDNCRNMDEKIRGEQQ